MRDSSIRFLLLPIALATSAVFACSVSAQITRPLHATNGTVHAEVLSGNTLYIGGAFTWVAPPTGGGVPISTASGAPASGFPAVLGTVYAVVPDGAGGWYIGGEFSAVGGHTRRNLAHVLSNNHVADWNPDASGSSSEFTETTIYSLALSGNTLYVGGNFTKVGGQFRNHIAALDAATGLATAWNPDSRGHVRALAVNGSTIYAGGSFDSIGAQARQGIAALADTTGLVTAWNPNANGTVLALVRAGSNVYAGGTFTNIGGQVRNRIAAMNVVTALATSWNPNANDSVDVLSVTSTSVYAGGTFTSIGGQTRNRIAAVDRTTGTASTWNPNANGEVFSLMASEDTVFAGGSFTSIGGQSRNRIAALATASNMAYGWNPNADGDVFAVVVNGTQVFAGGAFGTIGGVMRTNVAAIDVTTGLPKPWNPIANNVVRALAVSGANVYAGGDFMTIGGQSRNRIAALDTTAGNATSWNPNADGSVRTLTRVGVLVYAGGDFQNIGTFARSRIAALNASTGLGASWNPIADGTVNDLKVVGSVVYAAGSFQNIGVQPRNRIAAINVAGAGTATAWNPDANNTVDALAIDGSTVYAGGAFLSIGGQSRSGIAAIDAETGAPTAWNPAANNRVHAVVVSGGMVYAGGVFTSIGGQLRDRIAALDPLTGLARPWNPSADDTVLALVASATVLYGGGSFTVVGREPRGHTVALTTACQVPAAVGSPSVMQSSPQGTTTGDFDGDGQMDIAAAVSGGAQVLGNQGGGQFESLTMETTGGSGRGIATGDFNGDAVLDLAVSTPSALHVLLGETSNGSPTGGFGSPTSYTVGTNPTGVVVADFDLNGINDLAVAVSGANVVRVLFGQGTQGVGNGSFTVGPSSATLTAPMNLVVTDFDGDQIWDLAVTDSASMAVSILHGLGDGSFTVLSNPAVGGRPRPIVAGNFKESDSITDLAVGTSSPNGVSVLIGTGGGSFATAVPYPTSAPVRDLKVADFDNDGFPDLAAALTDGTIQYFYGAGSGGQGDGRFLTGPATSIGGTLSALEVNAFDPTVDGPTPIVAQSDLGRLVPVLGACTGGTGRTLELTSPNGGDQVTLGQPLRIQWSPGPLVMAVHVDVSRDDGIHWQRIASNLTGDEFVWSATAPGTPRGRIRVVDANMFTKADTSNGSFTMQPLVSVPPTGLPARPSFSLAYPNPSRSHVRFELRLPVAAMATVEVFDLAGRRVWILAHCLLAAGERTLIWDGRESGGGRAADGVYFVRARMAAFEVVRRVVRIE